MTPPPLFARYGVELEYMIVDRAGLDVLPIADEVLRSVAGGYESDADVGELSWSNELVLHVIEIKTGQPAADLVGLERHFDDAVGRINGILEAHGGMLLPTAMHPWMDPHAQTKLWPHECSPVYEAFNRIFDCRGHGWSNLQSVHLNLSFAGDDQFGRLHSAIRVLLPILPGLVASSPIADGRMTGLADTRLEKYRFNSRRIPSVSGRVIPEPVTTRQEYQEQILQRIYRDLAPHDPEGVLAYEWANARGAIARFDRSTIEIRVLDIQECPAADLACSRLIVAVLRGLIDERWRSFERLRDASIDALERIFLDNIRAGDEAVIDDVSYLELFGMTHARRATSSELWSHLFETLFDHDARTSPAMSPIGVILREGCLARRIVAALGGDANRDRLLAVYRRLGECLAHGRMFHAAD